MLWLAAFCSPVVALVVIAYVIGRCGYERATGQYVRKKSVDELRRDSVNFSNACVNNDLRKKLTSLYANNFYINYEMEMMFLQNLIKYAEERARFNNGTFTMEPDVEEMFARFEKDYNTHMSKN